jgi:hypothetical protein
MDDNERFSEIKPPQPSPERMPEPLTQRIFWHEYHSGDTGRLRSQEDSSERLEDEDSFSARSASSGATHKAIDYGPELA